MKIPRIYKYTQKSDILRIKAGGNSRRRTGPTDTHRPNIWLQHLHHPRKTTRTIRKKHPETRRKRTSENRPRRIPEISLAIEKERKGN